MHSVKPRASSGCLAVLWIPLLVWTGLQILITGILEKRSLMTMRLMMLMMLLVRVHVRLTGFDTFLA